MPERIHKMLARLGVGSRRQIERWIEEGRVTVNRKPAKIGQAVTGTEKIFVNGKQISLDVEIQFRVLQYHKPADEVCTAKDPEGRKTVFEKLPKLKGGRWTAVGRLDLTTSGILLFTTDGEFANKLMHPSAKLDREYAVRVHGRVDEAMMKRLVDGVKLEDGFARFTDIQAAGGEGTNQWFHVVLQEGRNHEVKRLWESQGVNVTRLKRVRFGPILLDRKLRKGQSRDLDKAEVNVLKDSLKGR